MQREDFKRQEIYRKWANILRNDPNVSANRLITYARRLGLSYARRQTLLKDIRSLRINLGLPPTIKGPYTTPEEAARGGRHAEHHRRIRWKERRP